MSEPAALKRTLSLPMMILYGLGTTIGAGIYALVREVDGIAEAYCCLLGRIGRSIDDPAVVDLKLRLAPCLRLADIQARAGEVTRHHLASVGNLWRELITGTITLF